MAYNGCTVIDMDAHIRERADKFVERPRLTPSARRKILGENAMRLCPRLRARAAGGAR